MFNIIFDFILFSIIGFIGEFIYCGLYGHKSGKALRGPYCPLYGLGGLLILVAIKNLPKNFFIIYFGGVIIASITEYTVSYILEKIFHARWWDYSKKTFNLNGRICLQNSLLFGVLSVILFYLYLPFKDYLFNNVNIIIIKIIVYFTFVDMFVDALITILELKEIKVRVNIIEKYGLKNKDKIKYRFSRLKTRLDYTRLIEEFDIKDRKMKFIDNYNKFKTSFKRRK